MYLTRNREITKMSKVMVVFCATLVVADSIKWKGMSPERVVEIEEEMAQVTAMCIAGTSYTVDEVHAELEKNIQDIAEGIDCIVKCYLQNGPKAISEDGKLTAPSFLLDEIKQEIQECADGVEAENIQNICTKALKFNLKCIA